MKGESTSRIRFLLLPEPLLSEIQASMFSDVFAQIESRLNPSHSRTGIHDPSARVAALSTVNKGIDATRQFLRSLLTRRNTLVPISLLPPEILARVFHFLVLKETPFSGGRKLGWIRVTHVCWHWRQVAFDDSSLWSRILGIQANTKWISEMLARAKNAPLDIEFYTAGMSSPEALLMIPPHLSHTRRLRFHDLINFDNVRAIFSWGAPALEHFELTAAPYSPVTFWDVGGNILFKGHAPRLRTFSLSRVVIPWSLIPRGQLTQLKIACPDEDFYSPSSLNQLVDLLDNCPALEILLLESCLPSQLANFPHGQTIHLPHLSCLRLRGSISRIMNMLNILKIPSSTLTTLHLDCISEITSTHNDLEGRLLPVISAQFRSPVPVEFKSLTVAIRRHVTFSLEIIASTFPSTFQHGQARYFKSDTVGNPELVLSFDRLSSPGRSTDLLKQACKTLPMLPISNLEFISTSTTDINDINWVELFGCCTNVTTMEVIGHSASCLVRALTSPTVTNAGSSKTGRKRKRDNRESTLVQPSSTVTHTHAPIFPKLKSLGLSNLNFTEGEHPSGILFDVIERGLQQRMASGAPLSLLRISDSDITTRYAKDLQKLVQDFHWDEYGGNLDGLDDIGERPRDPEEDLFVGHGAALLDSDSDGWDNDSDGWDHES